MQSLAAPCCSGQFASRPARLPARGDRLRVRAEVTAPPPAQKIRIKLKSYHPELLSESVEQIQQAADTTGAKHSSPAPPAPPPPRPLRSSPRPCAVLLQPMFFGTAFRTGAREQLDAFCCLRPAGKLQCVMRRPHSP